MAVTPGNWSYTVPSQTGYNMGAPTGASAWQYNPAPASALPVQTGTAVVADPWAKAAGASPSIGGPLFNMSNPTTWTNTTLTAPLTNYLTNWYVPQQQMAQNAYQWGNEYDEAMRRYNLNYEQTGQMNQFNMDLTGRQQQMAEWEAQQAANQWAQQFGYQQTQDEWSRLLAQQQLNYQEAQAQAQTARTQALTPAEVQQAYAQAAYQQAQAANIPLQYGLQQREATLAEQQQAALEAYRQQQLAQEYQLAQLQRQAAIEQANVAAFGRAQRPTARYMRNWG